MITTTTSATNIDGFNKPWFLLPKCIDGNLNFFVLLFELIEQFYLCNWKYMFWMFFILFLCYYSSQHITSMWGNKILCQPTITGQFFNIFCRSIFVGLSRNYYPTSEFIIFIYLKLKFSMFVQCFS
jgi:hypothetical protein